MKIAGSLFFTFLYIVSMSQPVLPIFEYLLNQDYIAKVLCINKEEPEIQCNGKCYLMKQIKKKEDKKKKSMPKIDMEKYSVFFFDFFNYTIKKSTSHLGIKSTFTYQNTYSYLYSFIDDHPPNYYS